jgi:magnesium transporter
LSFLFKRGEKMFLTPVRERIRNDKGNLRKNGRDYLAYSLIDIVADNYFTIVEKLGDKIEDAEEELITNPSSQILESIHKLKKEMMFLRKSVWPLREVIGSFERGESKLINKTTFVYFRDVYDHTIQVADTVETLRDMLSPMLDIYLSSVSHRLNE